MSDSRTLDEVWEELKNEDGESRAVFQTAEDTARIINELSEERIRQGLSQRQLAERCGLKQSAIARMESVQSIPRLDTLIRVANALNLKLEVSKETVAQSTIIELPVYQALLGMTASNYVYSPAETWAILKTS